MTRHRTRLSTPVLSARPRLRLLGVVALALVLALGLLIPAGALACGEHPRPDPWTLATGTPWFSDCYAQWQEQCFNWNSHAPGAPPVASIADGISTYQGAVTTLNGSASTANGGVVRYDWGFGDWDGGWVASTTGSSVGAVFAYTGWQQVWLRVTDQWGRTSRDYTWVYVRCDDTLPVPVITAPSSAAAGQSVNLSAAQSYDPHGRCAIYKWEFGDGTPAYISRRTFVDHTWTSPGTYTIKLTVWDYVNKSAYTTKQIVITTGAPTQPQNLSAADRPADEGGAVNLAWTASTGAGLSGYKIYRASSSTGPFTTPVATVGTVTSYTDTGLTDGSTYYYVVSAYAAGGESLKSAVASATPVDNNAPLVPSDLAAQDVSGDAGNAVRVTWTANAEPDLAGYRLTCFDGTTVVEARNVIDGTTTQVFSGLETGKTYTFRILAYDREGNESAQSAAASCAPTDELAPSVPTGLIAVNEIADGRIIDLGWNANTEGDLAGYYVLRRLGASGIDEQIATVNAPAAAYVDSTCVAGQQYFYSIKAFDTWGNVSPACAMVSANALDNLPPLPVTGVTASDVASDQGGGINAVWFPSASPDVASYAVDCLDSDGVAVGRWTGTTLSCTFDGLETGRQYSVVVYAKDAAGNTSAASDPATVTPLDNLAPATPGPLSAVDIVPDNGGSIMVSWPENTEADLAGYVVEWIDPDTTSHTLDVGLATSHQFDGLTPGATYTFSVRARDAHGNASALCAGVSQRGADELAPDAVTVSAVDHPNDQGGVIDVSWSQSASADAVGYNVYRDGALLVTVPGTTYTDAVTDRDEHVYSVSVVDAAGNVSDDSNDVAVAAVDNLAPAVPSGVSAVDVSDDEGAAVLVAFEGSTDTDIDGYEIQCSDSNGSLVAVQQAAAGDRNSLFTGLTNGVEYTFKVLAFDTSGNRSSLSAGATATPTDNLAPTAPVGVSAADVPGDEGGAIALSWTANSQADLAGYRVNRAAAASGPWDQVAAVSGTSWTDSAATLGQTWYYQVLAVDTNGNVSAPSDTASAASADNLAPAAPTGVSATDVPGDEGGSIALAWDAVAGADHYSVYRSTTSGSGYTKLADASGASYTDSTATKGQLFYYVVTASDAAANESVNSVEVSATSLNNLPPAAPASLSAVDTPDDNGGSIDLSWAAVSGATSYTVLRATGSDELSTLAEGVVGTSYTDTTATHGVTFRYAVKAANEDGLLSAASPEASAASKEDVPPSAPILSGCNGGDGIASAEWLAATDNVGVTGYEVWMKEGISGTWTKQADLADVSYTKTGLLNGMTYFFRVRAFDADGNMSPFSGELYATPVHPLNPPASVRIEDTDPRISYTSGWILWGPDPTYTGGTTHYSGTYRSRASITFNGTGIVMRSLGAARADRGMANVYVDGAYVTTVDMYSASPLYTSTIFDTGTLADGQHTLSVEVAYQKNAAANNYIIDVDCFDVYGAFVDSTAPAAPTGVGAVDSSTVSGGPAATVSWTANSAPDLSSYKIYRAAASGGPYTLIGHIAAPATSFSDTGVEYSTAYYYGVTAIDTAANESAQSSQVSVTPVEHVLPTAPAATVTGHGDGLVSLAWSGATDNVGVTGYDVWMKQGVNGMWTKQADVSAEAYTRSGLINGMTYYFKVRARDAAGNYSADSNVVHDAPIRQLGDVSMRIEDTDPVVSYQGTWLTWGPDSAYSGGTTHYSTIMHSSATLTFTGTGISVKADGAKRTDRGIANVYIDGAFVSAVDLYSTDTTYQATLWETSGLSDGTHSLTLEVSGQKNTAATNNVLDIDCFDIAGHVTDLGSLSAPQALTVIDMPADAGDALRLQWNAGAGVGATGYSIYRSASAAGPFEIVAQVPAGTFSCVDTGLTDGTTYYYRVTAFNAFGIESLPSSTVSGAPVYDLAPAAPTGFSATDVPADAGGSLRLAWNTNSESDVAGYRVYRSSSFGGPYSQVAEVASNSYLDTALTNDTVYYYKLTAVNSHGNASPYTAVVSAAPRDNAQAPAVPSGLSASDRLDDTGGVISVGWTAQTVPDLAGYRLYRASSAAGPWSVVYQGAATSFTDTGLTNAVDYFYAIAAYDIDGNESAQSTPVSAQARWDRGPSAPTGLLALGGDGYAGVAWLAATDELPVTGYEVWMKEGASGTYEKLADNTTTAFTKVGLTNETTYYFKVRAINSLGNLGAFSAEHEAVPHASTGSPQTTRIEDTDPSIVWEGTWFNWGPDASYSGGTTKYTNFVDSRATLTFNGTGISVKAVGARMGNRGMVDVFVDGVFQTTVDMYSATPTYQTTVYETQGLSDGQHTLTLRVTGTHSAQSNESIIDIDCFDVVQQ